MDANTLYEMLQMIYGKIVDTSQLINTLCAIYCNDESMTKETNLNAFVHYNNMKSVIFQSVVKFKNL